MLIFGLKLFVELAALITDELAELILDRVEKACSAVGGLPGEILVSSLP